MLPVILPALRPTSRTPRFLASVAGPPPVNNLSRRDPPLVKALQAPAAAVGETACLEEIHQPAKQNIEKPPNRTEHNRTEQNRTEQGDREAVMVLENTIIHVENEKGRTRSEV